MNNAYMRMSGAIAVTVMTAVSAFSLTFPQGAAYAADLPSYDDAYAPYYSDSYASYYDAYAPYYSDSYASYNDAYAPYYYDDAYASYSDAYAPYYYNDAYASYDDAFASYYYDDAYASYNDAYAPYYYNDAYASYNDAYAPYYDYNQYPSYPPLAGCADGCSFYSQNYPSYSYPPSYSPPSYPPRSYTPPVYSTPPVVYDKGCSYKLGGCVSKNVSSSYSNTSVNKTSVTNVNVDNSIKDSFNTTIKDSFNSTATNIQYLIQTQNPYIPPAVVQPTCTITYAQPYGSAQNQTYLSWSSTNATSAYISGIGSVAVSGSQYVYPTTNTTYSMTVYGAQGGSAICSVTAPYTPPVTQALYCTLTATPGSIQNGAASTLSWTSYGATSATLSDGLGNATLNGSLAVRPEKTRAYTLTVRDAYARTSVCTATVTVSGQYVALSSIPYTGFDGGLTTNSIYWGGLGLWALATGYIVTRYMPRPGRNMDLFKGFAIQSAYAGVPEPKILEERVVTKREVAAKEIPIPQTVATIYDTKETSAAPKEIPSISARARLSGRQGSADVMTLEVKAGETPRLVISRS